MTMRRRLLLGAMTALATPFSSANNAAAYPNKPIRWIVSYPAGGGADWFTRLIAERVSAILNQPIVIDNRPGAAGTIGLANLATSPADGYSVISGDVGTLTMSPNLLKTLPYDPIKAFTPVTLTGRGPFIWVVNSSNVPAKSFHEFVEIAKQNPGKFSYGSFGEGSLTHVMTELLCARAGIRLLHVPYKGGAPAQQDLLGGRIDAMFAPHTLWKAMEATGKARALTVSSRQRAPQLPDVPSIADEGISNYDVSPWQGVLVPAGTPAPIVDRLRDAIGLALRDPELSKKLVNAGYILGTSSTEEFAREIRNSLDTWGPIISSANIRHE